jgi:hypothetical protein
LLRIGAGDRNGLTVAEIEAKRIKVAIKEPPFTLVDQVERFGSASGKVGQSSRRF